MKFSCLQLNFNTNMNSNVVRVAPRPKNPSTYQLNNNTSNNYKFITTSGTNATSANVATAPPNSQSSPSSTNNFYTAASNNNNFSNFVSYPNYMNSNKMLMGNCGPILNHCNGVSGINGVGGVGVGVSSGGFISNSENNSKFFTNLNSHHNNNKTTSSSYNPFLIKKNINNNNNCDTQNHTPQMNSENLAVAVVASDKKYNSLKSNGIKKSPQFYSMRVNKCRRHHSRGGSGSRDERGDCTSDGNKSNTLPYIADVHDGDLEQPVYENLTDSIQIHESSYGYEPERMSIYRSDSGISNSSYDCITPVPAPRTAQRNCQSAPVYMNVPNSSSHSKNGYYHHHHRGHHNSKCKQNVVGGGGGSSGGSALQNGIGAFVNFEVRFDKHFQSNEN